MHYDKDLLKPAIARLLAHSSTPWGGGRILAYQGSLEMAQPRKAPQKWTTPDGQVPTAAKTLGSGCNIVGPLLHVNEVPGGAKTKEPKTLGQETLGKTPDMYLHVLLGI
jgi:hypothetical protein